MIPFLDLIVKPDTDEKLGKKRQLRDFRIDEYRTDLSSITKSQAESFVSRKKKENGPASDLFAEILIQHQRQLQLLLPNQHNSSTSSGERVWIWVRL